MIRAIQTAGWAAIALLLTGCAGVTTSTPMFGAADMSLAQLRPGVWKLTDGDCGAGRPGRDGAPCDVEMVIKGNEIGPTLAERGRGGSDASWPKVTYVLASGDPLILQVSVFDPGQRKTVGNPPVFVTYLAVKPATQAVDGQVTEAEAWSVACGGAPDREPGKAWARVGDMLPFDGRDPAAHQAAVDASADAAIADAVANNPAAVMTGDTQANGAAPPSNEDAAVEAQADAALPQPSVLFPGMKRLKAGLAGERCSPETADALRSAALESYALAPPLKLTWVKPEDR